MELNEFTQKLVEGDDQLKKAYASLLLQQLRLQELSARTNYNNLKMAASKAKPKAKPEFIPEQF